MPDKPPVLTISSTELTNAGFTDSGKNHYSKTLGDYGKTLFEKSVIYAEIDKADNREVTHEHVKAAAHSVANSFGKDKSPKWIIITRIGQYVCAAGVGVAGNNITNIYGAIGFVIAFSLGAILLYIESMYSK